jgi:hypothetical protein
MQKKKKKKERKENLILKVGKHEVVSKDIEEMELF